MRLRHLLLPLALTAAHAADTLPAEPQRTVPLGTFDQGLDGWDWNPGGEVKGAGGNLEQIPEGHTGGAARLRGDFTKGGSYVALKRQLNARPRRLTMWLKPEGIDAVDLRLTDGSGQTFQYTIPLKRGSDGQPASDWQQLDVEVAALTPTGHWGGADSGAWVGGGRDVWLMVSRTHLITKEVKTATLLVDDAQYTADPWRPPRPMPGTIVRPPADSIYGFSSHMIHSDLFFDHMGPYWRLDYILPLVLDGGFGVMREGLYQGKFFDDQKPSDKTPDAQTIAKEAAREARRPAARAAVEDYLARYAAAGVRVVLCPLFTLADRPGFNAYLAWVGDLAKRYPLQAVELHNEPNLKHFWGGTPADYATACKVGARLIKERSPTTPVIIGSVSHLWWKPGIAWLRSVLDSGVLAEVDGISVHPYRMKSAPEGGALREPETDPQGFERELRAFWALIQEYNPGNRPLGLYFTEYGFSSGLKGAVQADQTVGVTGVERQADYLSRSMILFTDVRLRGLPIEGIYWYDLKCDGEDPTNLEHNFGVVSLDTGTLRPGYHAYAAIAKAFGAQHDFAAIDLPVLANELPADQRQVVKSFAWRRLSDGALILPFWRLNQLQAQDVDLTTRLSWPLPAGFTAGAVKLHDLRSGTVSDVAVATADGRLSAELLVTARAAWLEVLPAVPTALATSGPWTSTLPAEFTAPGGARIRIDTARSITVGAAPELSVEIDNRAGTAPFAGRLEQPAGATALAAAAGATATVRISAPATTAAEPVVGSFLVVQQQATGAAVIGRGGYLVTVTATASTTATGAAPTR